MSCYTEETLLAYLDREVPELEQKKIQNHLKECQKCSQLLKEWEQLEMTMQGDFGEMLGEEFVLGVMEEIVKQDQHASTDPGKVVPKKRKWAVWKVGSIAASLVLALGTMLFFTSDSFASWVKEFSFLSADVNWEGYKVSEEDAKVAVVDGKQEVTSNGITFRVEEILLDNNRFIMVYSLRKPNGELFPANDQAISPIPYDMDKELVKKREGRGIFDIEWYTKLFEDSYAQVYLTDLNGKVLGSFQGVTPINDTFYAFEANTDSIPTDLPDQMLIKFESDKLLSKSGSWKLEIPLDTRAMKAKTQNNKLEHTFQTSLGPIVLKEIAYSPISTQLQFHYPESTIFAFRERFQYKIVDQNNRIIVAEWNYIQENKTEIGERSEEVGMFMGNGESKQTERVYFKKFPTDVEKLTFIITKVDGKPVDMRVDLPLPKK